MSKEISTEQGHPHQAVKIASISRKCNELNKSNSYFLLRYSVWRFQHSGIF